MHPHTTEGLFVMRTTLIRACIAVAATAVLAAGCASNDIGPATPGGGLSTPLQQATHNEHDVTFAQQMIPHHQQALDMAKLVPSRAASAKVKDLASRIEKAQDPEIQQMHGWLSRWGAEPPTSLMPGMNHGGGSMPGMMTEQEMGQLGQAKAVEFDRLWLEMMIKHHQGAIEMAKTELATGTSSDAKKLAQQIIDAQQAEITEMQGLLKTS